MNEFEKLNINETLVTLLKKNGIKIPTEIQKKTIPHIFNDENILFQAQTGSGKTFAFLLPIIQKLETDTKEISTLIISPTRELAIQIKNECDKINYKNFNIVLAYGGKEISTQVSSLKKQADIVIGTPGRLVDLITNKDIDFSKINTLVLDEVDQLFLMGFKPELDIILKSCGQDKQIICTSATVNSDVKKLIYKLMKNPIILTQENEKIDYNRINQYVIKTTDRRKLNSLSILLNETNPFMGIIFCRTKVRVDKLEIELSEKGYSVQKIHSDIPQVKREKIIKSFRNAEFQFLVATDVIARGIDIKGITHIFNYDITDDVESYVHRIGRTARASNKGESYLFVTDKNLEMLDEIEIFLDKKLINYEVEYSENVISSLVLPTKKYNKKINTRTKNIENQKNKFRK